MPESGRRYRSVIVKFNGVSSSSPVEQLLADDRWVGHLDIDFSGEKLMFTGNGFGKKENRPWDVFELDLKTGKKESLTAHMPADTDSYNSCYLPDGRIIFVNTSGMQGVPCVAGVDYVGSPECLPEKNPVLFLRKGSVQLFSSFIRSLLFLVRSEEHTSELQSPAMISYAVFCLKKKKK